MKRKTAIALLTVAALCAVAISLVLGPSLELGRSSERLEPSRATGKHGPGLVGPALVVRSPFG